VSQLPPAAPLITPPTPPFKPPTSIQAKYIVRLLEGLAEHQDLQLIVDGEHTSTSNTTQDVSTRTLEQGADTLLGDDLATGIEGRLVLDGLTRGHHHTTTDGIQRVGGDTGTSCDGPAEHEGGQEVTLERADQDDGLERVVHSKVQTTVDDNTSDGGTETTIETSDTISGQGLLVDVDQTVELTLTTSLGVLAVVGQTGTSIVQGVDEQQGRGTGSLRRSATAR